MSLPAWAACPARWATPIIPLQFPAPWPVVNARPIPWNVWEPTWPVRSDAVTTASAKPIFWRVTTLLQIPRYPTSRLPRWHTLEHCREIDDFAFTFDGEIHFFPRAAL